MRAGAGQSLEQCSPVGARRWVSLSTKQRVTADQAGGWGRGQGCRASLRAALPAWVHKLPAAWVPWVSDSPAQSQHVFRSGPRLECWVKCQRGSLLVTVAESPLLRRQEWGEAVPLSLSKGDESAQEFVCQGTTEAVRVADG